MIIFMISFEPPKMRVMRLSRKALAVVGDVSAELGDFLAELPSDASTLETKLARQAELRTLTRKYAADVDGVLAWADDARRRLAGLDVSEDALAALQRRVDDLESVVVTAATAITKARTKAAKGLAKAVTAELAGLAMAGAGFAITVTPLTARADDTAPLVLPDGTRVHAGSDGVDAVEFGFAPHRGSDVLPLARSASGGELSRVMLALEVVLSASAENTTMVFDEVDAGVGGRAAVQIGRRLARLARTHQVIVVTHLPQVAAYADAHLMVDSAGGRGGKASVLLRSPLLFHEHPHHLGFRGDGNIEMAAARPKGLRDVLRARRRRAQDDYRVFRWLLHGFQQRIRRLGGEPIGVVDDDRAVAKCPLAGAFRLGKAAD